MPVTPGKGITLRVQDPAYAGTPTTQVQQRLESSLEGVPPGGLSGVDPQESSPAWGSNPELGATPTCSVGVSDTASRKGQQVPVTGGTDNTESRAQDA